MTQKVKVENIIKSLINGSSRQQFCVVCLRSLEGTISEDVNTMIFNEKEEFSIPEVIKNICKIKLPISENDRVCINCLKLATATYKFHQLIENSKKIWEFYVTQLTIELSHSTLTNEKNYVIKENVEDIVNQQKIIVLPDLIHMDENLEEVIKQEIRNDVKTIIKKNSHMCKKVCVEKSSVKPGTIVPLKRKKSWKRKTMMSVQCMQCPAKYRFLGILKEHMKMEHGLEIHICEICRACIEDEEEYKFHIQTHTNLYICDKCNMTFRGRYGIINHLKWHEDIKKLILTDQGYICEICGLVFENDDSLIEHHFTSHAKNYTCYYCGKMYKGEASFESHIRKHEFYINKNNSLDKILDAKRIGKRCSFTCCQCGKSFKHERSLMLHERLHNNERPFICEICGRTFVTVNRRNQHAMCSHTAPSRRCPLCPALFHLRSMVNTHIKKVHLKTDKRCRRPPKYQNVYWKTKTVPIQELSIAIQDKVFNLDEGKNNSAI